VKRGISVVPVKFVADWEDQDFIALVNIYPDGSVGIYQSGCEMGQGLDVKVAQVCISLKYCFISCTSILDRCLTQPIQKRN
jgi:xanthine dehydrogenase large subunit